MIALLVVVAVVLLVMWLTRRRTNSELSGNEKGLVSSNAVYGGKLTEYGYQQILHVYKSNEPPDSGYIILANVILALLTIHNTAYSF